MTEYIRPFNVLNSVDLRENETFSVEAREYSVYKLTRVTVQIYKLSVVRDAAMK